MPSRIAIPRRLVLAFSAGLALWALVLVPAVRAQDCVAPPGTSGIDQYCESIPSPDSDSGGRLRHGSNHSLSEGTRRNLQHRGVAGQRILDLVNGATGERNGKSATSRGNLGGPRAGSHGTGTPAGRSDNPVSAIRSAIDSGSTAGPGFVWMLVILALVLSALAWVRFRRRGQSRDA